MLFIAASCISYAQKEIIYTDNLFLENNENEFYFHFKKQNKLIIKIQKINHFKYLPNTGEVMSSVKKFLDDIKDSLQQDAFSKKINFVYFRNIPPKIAITTHSSNKKSYSYQQGELVEVKTTQDTLKIQIPVETDEYHKYKFNDGRKDSLIKASTTFSFSFILNNIKDIDEFPDSIIDTCLNRIKKDIEPYISGIKKIEKRLFAQYNMVTGSSTPIVELPNIRKREYDFSYQAFSVGIQYVRGSFAPSVSLGLKLSVKHNRYYDFLAPSNIETTTTNYYLLWEPHFFFSRDANNKLITQRNDFLTLKLIQLEHDRKPGMDFIPILSLGYLIHRQGNWFEKNTFKWGISGFGNEMLQIAPEFFFNDFFKNFSASLKLTITLE